MLLRRIMSLCSVVVAIAAAPALADTGFYVGATAGQSHFHASETDFEVAVATSLDKTQHFAFGGLIGYRLAPAFSIEAAYMDLGQLRVTSSATVGPTPVHYWTSDFTVKAKGPTLAALGILPLSPLGRSTAGWDSSSRG
jgi:hypothetical protein